MKEDVRELKLNANFISSKSKLSKNDTNSKLQRDMD